MFNWASKGPAKLGNNTACCFSGVQDVRVEVGSWFHHSRGDKNYRLFSDVRGQQSLACPHFIQCTDLSKAVVNQSDILLCWRGGSPCLNLSSAGGRWTTRCASFLKLGMDRSDLWSQGSLSDIPGELKCKTVPCISLRVASSLNCYCKDVSIHHLDSSIFKCIPSRDLSRSAAECSHPGSQGTRAVSTCSELMLIEGPPEWCKPGRQRNINSYSKKQFNNSLFCQMQQDPHFTPWLKFGQGSVKEHKKNGFYRNGLELRMTYLHYGNPLHILRRRFMSYYCAPLNHQYLLPLKGTLHPIHHWEGYEKDRSNVKMARWKAKCYGRDALDPCCMSKETDANFFTTWTLASFTLFKRG